MTTPVPTYRRAGARRSIIRRLLALKMHYWMKVQAGDSLWQNRIVSDITKNGKPSCGLVRRENWKADLAGVI